MWFYLVKGGIKLNATIIYFLKQVICSVHISYLMFWWNFCFIFSPAKILSLKCIFYQAICNAQWETLIEHIHRIWFSINCYVQDNFFQTISSGVNISTQRTKRWKKWNTFIPLCAFFSVNSAIVSPLENYSQLYFLDKFDCQ